MIVDTSALVALLRAESDAARVRAALRSADCRRMSAATYVEAGIVIDSKGDAAASRQLDALFETLRMEIVPITSTQARIARRAYRDFGTGSGHPAQLNFGDCYAYALAIDADEPLLFTGDDFGYTDVRRTTH